MIRAGIDEEIDLKHAFDAKNHSLENPDARR